MLQKLYINTNLPSFWALGLVKINYCNAAFTTVVQLLHKYDLSNDLDQPTVTQTVANLSVVGQLLQ